MNQTTLSKWLNLIITILGLCGLIVYAWIVPSFGKSMVARYPEFAFSYWPWLILIMSTAIPCYMALILGWKISINIRMDRSFSSENALFLKWIAILAIADSGFFFAMNIVFLFFNMNHPGFVLLSLILLVIGVAISAFSATLSHLVKKAADLQEQNDLTI